MRWGTLAAPPGWPDPPEVADVLLRHVSAIIEQPYIIVADDDPDILEAISTILESQPYKVATAQDGEQCLSLVHKRKPDLLILDLLMPKVDGFAVIRELRGEPRYADMPIMILTTVVEDASRRRYELETGQDMGIHTYMQKPASPEALLKSVKTELGR